jgi:hypothetical protein
MTDYKGSQTSPHRSSILNVASEEEVVAGINTLTERQLKDLKLYARWKIRKLGRRRLGRNFEDLFQEAITSTLAGNRHWNKDHYDFFRYLLSVISSISSNWYRKFDESEPDLESEVINTNTNGIESNPLYNFALPSQDGRRVVAVRDYIKHIETLVSCRPLASLIVDGLREGMTGPDIKESLGISQKEFETEMKWLRRTVRADQK